MNVMCVDFDNTEYGVDLRDAISAKVAKFVHYEGPILERHDDHVHQPQHML